MCSKTPFGVRIIAVSTIESYSVSMKSLNAALCSMLKVNAILLLRNFMLVNRISWNVIGIPWLIVL